MKFYYPEDVILIDKRRAKCPECGGQLMINEFDWDIDQKVINIGGTLSCEKEHNGIPHNHWETYWIPIVDTVEEYVARSVRVIQREDNHEVYLWNKAYIRCPLDNKLHWFGCKCIRDDPTLLSPSIRAWYQENWAFVSI